MTSGDTRVEATEPGGEHRDHVLREGVTMALYLAISLLAVLAAVPDREQALGPLVGTVWGTTIGLALAHWLAFRLSGVLLAGGRLPDHDRRAIAAQFAATVAVATLTSVPLVVAGGSEGLGVARLVLAGTIGLAGYGAAVRRDAPRTQALLYAGAVVAVALLVALVKNSLAHH
jgi:hypothetical protein